MWREFYHRALLAASSYPPLRIITAYKLHKFYPFLGVIPLLYDENS